ncbi:hypothetical protein ACWC0A_06370 [Streptomyces scopuliridis]
MGGHDLNPAGPAVRREKTVFNIAKDVAEAPYAIGYTGVAHVDQAVKGISLSDHAGDPAYAPTFSYVNKRPGKQLDPVVEELIRFILGKRGQSVTGGQQVFLPLRSGQAKAGLDALNAAP